jgi:hypothetical protein
MGELRNSLESYLAASRRVAIRSKLGAATRQEAVYRIEVMLNRTQADRDSLMAMSSPVRPRADIVRHSRSRLLSIEIFVRGVLNEYVPAHREGSRPLAGGGKTGDHLAKSQPVPFRSVLLAAQFSS